MKPHETKNVRNRFPRKCYFVAISTDVDALLFVNLCLAVDKLMNAWVEREVGFCCWPYFFYLSKVLKMLGIRFHI